MPGTSQLIEEFLAQKRIAVVGVSRHARDFNRTLFREFRKRGYDVVPVNPQATEIDGQRCYARVQDIQPMVEAALLLTPSETTEKVVWHCAEAGIHRVWMYRVGGKGAVSQAALEFCNENGIRVVPGFCPLMFLPDAGWFHRLHGFVMKITGSYPR